ARRERRGNAPGAGGQQPQGLSRAAGEGAQDHRRQRNVAGRDGRAVLAAGASTEAVARGQQESSVLVIWLRAARPSALKVWVRIGILTHTVRTVARRSPAGFTGSAGTPRDPSSPPRRA